MGLRLVLSVLAALMGLVGEIAEAILSIMEAVAPRPARRPAWDEVLA